MRVFIALEIPKEIKKEIGKIQKDLEYLGIKSRWVKPEIAHLTLAFLGSITPDKIKPIEKILSEIAGQIKPVKPFLNKVGCFPSLARARIIFLSLAGELGKLNALAIGIRKQLKKQKIYFDEKRFSPHLTLGRLKNRQNLTEIIKKVKIKRVKFSANLITLRESELTPKGPIYKTLKEASLAPASKK